MEIEIEIGDNNNVNRMMNNSLSNSNEEENEEENEFQLEENEVEELNISKSSKSNIEKSSKSTSYSHFPTVITHQSSFLSPERQSERKLDENWLNEHNFLSSTRGARLDFDTEITDKCRNDKNNNNYSDNQNVENENENSINNNNSLSLELQKTQLELESELQGTLKQVGSQSKSAEDRAVGIRPSLSSSSIAYLEKLQKQRKKLAGAAGGNVADKVRGAEDMISVFLEHSASKSLPYSDEKSEISTSLCQLYIHELEVFQNKATEVEKKLNELELQLSTESNLTDNLLSKLENSNHLLGKGTSQIGEQNTAIHYMLDHLKKQLQLETNKTDSIKEETSISEKELQKLNGELKDLTTINNYAEEKLYDLRNNLKTVSADLDKVKLQEAQRQVEMEEKVDSLCKKNLDIQKALVNANSEIEDKVSRQKILELQLGRAKNEIKSLANQYAKRDNGPQDEKVQKKKMVKEAMLKGAPTGEVTLVFSDVEGSKELMETATEAMILASEIHNTIIRNKIKETGGYEVKNDSYSFMVAFQNPLDALNYCMMVQEVLLGAEWPRELLKNDISKEILSADGRVIYRGLRVNMGMHSGKPQCQPNPISGRMDYLGSMVNKSARIASMSTGGRVFLSENCFSNLDSDNSIDELKYTSKLFGKVQLKGITGEENIIQVLPRPLAERFDIEYDNSFTAQMSEDNRMTYTGTEKIEEQNSISPDISQDQNHSSTETSQADIHVSKGGDTVSPEKTKVQSESDSLTTLFSELDATLTGEKANKTDDGDYSLPMEVPTNSLEKKAEELQRAIKGHLQEEELTTEEMVHMNNRIKKLHYDLKYVSSGVAREKKLKETYEQEIAINAHERLQKNSTLHKALNVNISMKTNTAALKGSCSNAQDEISESEEKLRNLESDLRSHISLNAVANSKLNVKREYVWKAHEEVRQRAEENKLMEIKIKELEDKLAKHENVFKFKKAGSQLCFGREVSVINLKELAGNDDNITSNERGDLQIEDASEKMKEIEGNLRNAKEEKENYSSQLKTLEYEFSTIDSQANNLVGIIDIEELLEKQKKLELQLSKARVERDVVAQQIASITHAIQNELSRKEKGLHAAEDQKEREIAHKKDIREKIQNAMLQKVKKDLVRKRAEQIKDGCPPGQQAKPYNITRDVSFSKRRNTTNPTKSGARPVRTGRNKNELNVRISKLSPRTEEMHDRLVDRNGRSVRFASISPRSEETLRNRLSPRSIQNFNRNQTDKTSYYISSSGAASDFYPSGGSNSYQTGSRDDSRNFSRGISRFKTESNLNKYLQKSYHHDQKYTETEFDQQLELRSNSNSYLDNTLTDGDSQSMFDEATLAEARPSPIGDYQKIVIPPSATSPSATSPSANSPQSMMDGPEKTFGLFFGDSSSPEGMHSTYVTGAQHASVGRPSSRPTSHELRQTARKDHDMTVSNNTSNIDSYSGGDMRIVMPNNASGSRQLDNMGDVTGRIQGFTGSSPRKGATSPGKDAQPRTIRGHFPSGGIPPGAKNAYDSNGFPITLFSTDSEFSNFLSSVNYRVPKPTPAGFLPAAILGTHSKVSHSPPKNMSLSGHPFFSNAEKSAKDITVLSNSASASASDYGYDSYDPCELFSIRKCQLEGGLSLNTLIKVQHLIDASPNKGDSTLSLKQLELFGRMLMGKSVESQELTDVGFSENVVRVAEERTQESSKLVFPSFMPRLSPRSEASQIVSFDSAKSFHHPPAASQSKSPNHSSSFGKVDPSVFHKQQIVPRKDHSNLSVTGTGYGYH